MNDARRSRYYTFIQPVLENKLVKSYSAYIFSLVTATLLILFAIRPTANTIVVLRQTIATNQEALDQLNEKARNLSQGQRNYNNLSPAVREKINAAVPANPQLTALIRSLESAIPPQASISAMQIQPLVVISPASPSAFTVHPTLGEVDFNYTITGDYNQILSTINNIGKLPRLISIRNMTISKQTEGPAVLSISGKGYYLK